MIITSRLNILSIYENIVEEFELKLNRSLTDEEKKFLKWLAQKASEEQAPPT